MRILAALLFALATASAARAQTPTPIVLHVTIEPYVIPIGGSNSVITIYKSTSFGTVSSPWKKTAIFPATRTNTSITVLPGKYYFYATASVMPWGESPPSNICTNTVTAP